MVKVKQVLRHRQQGRCLREIARGVGLDRKTVRRYLELAVSAGFDPNGSEVSDEIVGAVVAQLHPGRPGGVGRRETWLELEGQHAFPPPLPLRKRTVRSPGRRRSEKASASRHRGERGSRRGGVDRACRRVSRCVVT